MLDPDIACIPGGRHLAGGGHLLPQDMVQHVVYAVHQLPCYMMATQVPGGQEAVPLLKRGSPAGPNCCSRAWSSVGWVAVHVSDGYPAAVQVPWERKYLAGWGYLLSRDVAQHVVNATSAWNRAPDKAPGWYAGLHWEDVLIGLIASGVTGEEPQVRCMQFGAPCSQHINLVFTPWSCNKSCQSTGGRVACCRTTRPLWRPGRAARPRQLCATWTWRRRSCSGRCTRWSCGGPGGGTRCLPASPLTPRMLPVSQQRSLQQTQLLHCLHHVELLCPVLCSPGICTCVKKLL